METFYHLRFDIHNSNFYIIYPILLGKIVTLIHIQKTESLSMTKNILNIKWRMKKELELSNFPMYYDDDCSMTRISVKTQCISDSASLY